MQAFSIDLETTGLVPGTHGITEMAAVMFDPFDRTVPYRTFYRWINPEGYVWSNDCLKLHANWLAKVLPRVDAKQWEGSPKICMNIHELNNDFFEWVTDCDITLGRDRINVAGKNAGTFDFPFLLANGFPRDIFDPRVIDAGPLHLQKGDDYVPSLRRCKERTTHVFANKEVAHNGLEDAFDVVYLIQEFYAQRQTIPMP